jgi:two-component sensor histidine kinase
MDETSGQPLANRISRFIRGISFQLIALLSVALLPVGAISISQSLTFARDTRASAEVLLRSLTAEAATLELRLIETGFTASDRLASAVVATRDTPAACSRVLTDFITGQSLFTFAGFTDLNGDMRCVSQGTALSLSEKPSFIRILQTQTATVDRIVPEGTNENGTLVTMQPLRDDGNVVGFLTIALPRLGLESLSDTSGIPRPSEVAIYNAAGEIVASVAGLDTLSAHLPDVAAVQALLAGSDQVSSGNSVDGTAVTFAKVTLIPGIATAIGVWPVDNPITQSSGVVFNAVLFPLLMWIASLAVAFLAAQRLVINPIYTLRSSIRRFALGDRSFPVSLPSGAPLELQDVISTFSRLEKIIGRNETALAMIADEKLLLLREVHHRIKNNLQMISSIINIQRRKTDDDEVRLVLRSLQDRVLSIAAIDQSLYHNGDVWDVRADELIGSITERLISVNLEQGHKVDVTTDYDAVLLHADQIGPLSLLANEAVTNALKYVGQPTIGRAFVRISLKWDGDQVRFTAINSMGPNWNARGALSTSTRLGTPLIQAFSSQLGGVIQSGPVEADQTYVLTIAFTPSAPAIDQDVTAA